MDESVHQSDIELMYKLYTENFEPSFRMLNILSIGKQEDLISESFYKKSVSHFCECYNKTGRETVNEIFIQNKIDQQYKKNYEYEQEIDK